MTPHPQPLPLKGEGSPNPPSPFRGRGWGWGSLALRLALAATFAYAAATKVPDLATFAEEIANYRVLPPALVPWLAAALPGIELVAGLALLRRSWARTAALLLGGLLAVFIVALSQALLRGIDLRCGCFGGAEQATWGTVARDAVMLAGCLFVAWREPPTLALTAPDRDA